MIYCKTISTQVTYVEGVITSSTTSWPITYASILDETNLKYITSDSIGNFKLPIYSKNTLLHIICVGFENTQIGRGFKIGLGANLVYDYSSITFDQKRLGIRPFILPVFF